IGLWPIGFTRPSRGIKGAIEPYGPTELSVGAIHRPGVQSIRLSGQRLFVAVRRVRACGETELATTSDVKRRPAAAMSGTVGVAEVKAGCVSSFDVINLGAIQVLVAERVYVELNAVRLEALVEFRRRFFEVQIVLKTSASAPDDPQPQPLFLEALGLGNL